MTKPTFLRVEGPSAHLGAQWGTSGILYGWSTCLPLLINGNEA